MKRVVFISIGILFLVFSLIFGLKSCSDVEYSGYLDLCDGVGEHTLIGKGLGLNYIKSKTIEDGYFELHRSTYNDFPKQRFSLSFTKKGLDASLNQEIEIPLIYHRSNGVVEVTDDKPISEYMSSSLYYVNNILNSSINLPFSYYDYVDKLTYSADKGFSIYFNENYPKDDNIDWNKLKRTEAIGFGYKYSVYSICETDESANSYAYFNVYLADGSGGYAPLNKAAENYESSLAAKSFLKENIGYILLTVLHAVMLALLIRYEIKHRREERVGTGNIVACILFALSVGFHIYGIATQKMASPYVFGSTLLSVFAFLYPTLGLFARKRVLPAILCLCAAVGEYVTYFILYSSSDLYLPMSYTIGTILALFAAAGLFFVITAAFDEEFPSPIISPVVHILLLAALCALCIFAIPIGLGWIGFMAGAIFVMTILCFLGIGGGGYTVYLIIFD